MFFFRNIKKEFMSVYNIENNQIIVSLAEKTNILDFDILYKKLKSGEDVQQNKSIAEMMNEHYKKELKLDTTMAKSIKEYLIRENNLKTIENDPLSLEEEVAAMLTDSFINKYQVLSELSTLDVSKYFNKEIKELKNIKILSNQNYLSEIRTEPLYKYRNKLVSILNTLDFSKISNLNLLTDSFKDGMQKTFVYNSKISWENNFNNAINADKLLEYLKKVESIVVRHKNNDLKDDFIESFIGKFLIYPNYSGRLELSVDIKNRDLYQIYLRKSKDKDCFDIIIYDKTLKNVNEDTYLEVLNIIKK